MDRVQPGISRDRSSGYSRRTSSPENRAARYDERPAARRAAAPHPTRRSAGSQRPPQRRPSNNNRRRPPKRRSNAWAYAIIAALAVVLVAVILLVARPGEEVYRPVSQDATPVVTVTVAPEETAAASGFDTQNTATQTPTQYATISQMLGDTGNQVEGLAADQMVQVEDLSIKEGLSDEWLNVLLLGTDERVLSESARTDAMMICSINLQTGQVKLTSIMRDLAVEFKDIGKYSGTYRINAANYFGGSKLAMKTVNELFDMNIQYYVMVNFFGFGKIAQTLGGVEVDISEAEMKKINEDIVKQYKMAYLAGVTDFDPEQKYLEEYGQNVHLNGNQTLAYARIRHLDGGDYTRTTRQQTVLKKLLGKVKKLGMMEMLQLGTDLFSMIKTNMEWEDIFKIASIVVSSGISDVDTLRLPEAKTYKEEVRNDEGMLYDCDFATNAVRLYDFIYEQ